MASQTIQTSIDQVDQAILDLTLNPRPNVSYGGRSYSWESLLSMLIEKRRVMLKNLQDSDGPFEVQTYGR